MKCEKRSLFFLTSLTRMNKTNSYFGPCRFELQGYLNDFYIFLLSLERNLDFLRQLYCTLSPFELDDFKHCYYMVGAVRGRQGTKVSFSH